MTLIQELRTGGERVAVVISSKKNCDMVLEAVGIWDLFGARVDSDVVAE